MTPADFAQLVREPATEAGRLQRGAELVVALVGGCEHAGVSVLTPAFMETVAVTDDVGLRGDGWQHELSEGPGLEAVRSRTTVVSQDLRTDSRWRTWGPRAVEALGVRAAMSVLLDTWGESVGSLTLYADRSDVWDDERQTLAVTLAGQLALASADARMLDDRQRALLARGSVGQAQGIVMERFGMTADQALDHLRRLSEGSSMALVHLAERVVETRELPSWRADEPWAGGLRRSRPAPENLHP
ncbi:MAG: GAF and ANTAR domain-containing protein [Janthinobacterium lividum]